MSLLKQQIRKKPSKLEEKKSFLENNNQNINERCKKSNELRYQRYCHAAVTLFCLNGQEIKMLGLKIVFDYHVNNYFLLAPTIRY